MSRDPDEILRRAITCAHGAVETVIQGLGPEVTVEELRQVWGRWLQAARSGGAAGMRSSERHVVSELIMAAIGAASEREPIPPGMLTDEPAVTVAPEDVDPTLLDEAGASQASVIAVRQDLLAARSEVTRLEAELNRARARLGNAIRRWYEGGASVTSIAERLGMSEEGVARVVGSPRQGYTPVLVCSFCARSARLIAGPSVHVCADCVEIAQRVGRGEKPVMVTAPHLHVGQGEQPCNFCAKTRRMVGFMIEDGGVRICDECLDLCAEIIAEEFDV